MSTKTFIGVRQVSTYEYFEIDAENAQQAKDKLETGFLLSTPCRVMESEPCNHEILREVND